MKEPKLACPTQTILREDGDLLSCSLTGLLPSRLSAQNQRQNNDVRSTPIWQESPSHVIDKASIKFRTAHWLFQLQCFTGYHSLRLLNLRGKDTRTRNWVDVRQRQGKGFILPNHLFLSSSNGVQPSHYSQVLILVRPTLMSEARNRSLMYSAINLFSLYPRPHLWSPCTLFLALVQL